MPDILRAPAGEPVVWLLTLTTPLGNVERVTFTNEKLANAQRDFLLHHGVGSVIVERLPLATPEHTRIVEAAVSFCENVKSWQEPDAKGEGDIVLHVRDVDSTGHAIASLLDATRSIRIRLEAPRTGAARAAREEGRADG